MPDTLPDRLSNNPRSPFFKEDVLKHDIGVRFNGAEKTNVEEYCVSEGWIRVEVGKTKDRYGNPMTIKLSGKVEPYFKDQKPERVAEPESREKPTTDEKPAATQQSAKAEKGAKAKRPSPAGKAEKSKAKPATPAKKKKKK